MKKVVFFLCVSFVLVLNHPAHAEFPVHLGGFVLGDDISNYTHLMHMATCRQVTFNDYLEEGEIIAQHGFKSGLVAYGNCDKPNKILRIKLKYANSTKKFFNILLDRYKAKLGDPSEYKGDPFQTLIAWKWSFTNAKNERISLILQHNQMVEDEKIGTAVKMTLTTQIDKERDCYLSKFPEKETSQDISKTFQADMWDLFVPY